MQVGADDGAAAHALKARAAVVAVALEDAAQRRLARAQRGAAAVVLEAGQDARAVEAGQLHLDRDVADQPRAVDRADGLEVDQPDPGHALVAQLVVVAEQLDAAADAQDDRAAVGGGVQRVALGVDQILRAELLVAVLAAAEVEEVVRVGVDRVAEAGGGQLEADPAPRAAPLQHQHVAAVGVDVHQVGVERADAQRLVRHRAGPPPWSRRRRRWPGSGALTRRSARPPRPPRRPRRRSRAPAG